LTDNSHRPLLRDLTSLGLEIFLLYDDSNGRLHIVHCSMKLASGMTGGSILRVAAFIELLHVAVCIELVSMGSQYKAAILCALYAFEW